MRYFKPYTKTESVEYVTVNGENIPFGNILAPYLIWKSPLKNYAGMFQYTLAYYELNIIDKSALDSTIDLNKLPKKLKRLAM